jgi:hypothetical protein
MISHKAMVDGIVHRLSIDWDAMPEDPHDPSLEIKFCFKHKRYSFPCDANVPTGKEADKWYILPVWGYDHSLMSIKAGDRTYPFNDIWDSGLLGYVFTLKADWKGQGRKEAAIKAMHAEVRMYNAYMSGEVYYFLLEAMHDTGIGWEIVDSCGGFYSIADIAEHAPAEFGELLA